MSNGKQLDANVLGREQRAGGDRREPDGNEEHLRARPALEQRPRDARIEAAHRADVVMAARLGLLGVETPAREAQQQPGRDRHRDEEREQHRNRGVGRNRAHVRAHHPAHEHHRQQRGDDRQRRDDGRVADFGDRLDGGFDKAAPVAHRPVAGDVLDHDDRVVDQDADREDEREQADPVDRVAHQPGGEQRQQDRGRDDDEHDDAFAPADRQRDQDDDRQRRQAEMEQELVGLLGRGRAVVARHADVEPGRNDAALDDFEALQDVVGDRDGIGALALGDGEGDGGTALELAVGEAGHRPGAMLGLGGADDDVGDVLDVDRPAVARGQQQQADVGDALQGLAGDDGQRVAAVAQRADDEGPVGVGQLVDELVQRHAIERQPLGIGLDADLVRAAADDVGAADVVDLGELVLQLLGDLKEAVVGPLAGRARSRPKASDRRSRRR